jgi:succinyl-CoA synthetase beta subunit
VGRVLEHFAKQIISRAGIPTPQGDAASTPDEAVVITGRLGGSVAVKALVPAGKRGKAGAVRLVASPQEAGKAAESLLGGEFGGYPVHQVLVEKRIAIRRELYLSLTIDRDRACTRILASVQGGIEVEEIIGIQPEALASIEVKSSEGLPGFHARQLWRDAGISGQLLPRVGSLTCQLYQTFLSIDAYLLEINPLVETDDGELMAVGTVLAIDDSALFRHPELQEMVQAGSEKVWRLLTEREEQVNAINAAEPYRGSARYLELDGGDIGFLCGGGGASLVLFDGLVHSGGRPANYAEFGGNPTESKVAGLAAVVLSKPGVRGLFVAHNITNNTQVDVVARGVVRALRDAGLADGFPVVAREVGLHDVEGREIFEAAGISYFGEENTLTDAARAMVAMMNRRDEG